MGQTDDLSRREREVLDLVRQGLTNDQIAERLGISSDGVKYHVTQINSRLGVNSRYEAVAATERPARWWERAVASPAWPVAGAVVVVATVAGVAVLAWTVLSSGGDEHVAVNEMTVDDLYAAVADAVSHDGEILHTVFTTTGFSGGIDSPPAAGEMWLNPALGAIFYPGADDSDQGSLLVGDYMLGAHGVGLSEPHQAAQCSTPATWLGALLACQAGADVSVGQDDRDGRDAVVVTHYYRLEPDDPEEAGNRLLELTSVIYLDGETLLALDSQYTVKFDGELDTDLRTSYEHEFVPADPQTEALFDPEQFTSTLGVDEFDPEGPPKPVYWFGERWDAQDGGKSLVRAASGPPWESSAARGVSYITSEYMAGVAIETLSAQGWANYQTSTALEVLDDPDCVSVHEEEIGGWLFTAYQADPFEYPEPDAQEPPDSCKRRIYALNELWSGLLLTWRTPDGGAVKVVPVFAQRPITIDVLREALETIRLYENSD
ncbi:MAG: helix-turn-helix transcriptional regulator [Dehalococcoidia bacterium]